MAAIESMVSGLIVGVTYGFLSGQPLTILGSTGPILVFETIMYDLCKTLDWDYLPFRLWTGVWCGLILIILVATDASAFVCYITRYVWLWNSYVEEYFLGVCGRICNPSYWDVGI